jgi:transcriptional regulator with XRE-family HTH domain
VKATIDDPFVDMKHATKAAEMAADLRGAFGQNLRQARIAEGLTQHDVQDRTGVPQDRLSDIEAGQIDPPLDMMVALASVVGRDLWTLLTPPPGGVELWRRSSTVPALRRA